MRKQIGNFSHKQRMKNFLKNIRSFFFASDQSFKRKPKGEAAANE